MNKALRSLLGLGLLFCGAAANAVVTMDARLTAVLGGVANTKGATWTELDASTSARIDYLVVGLKVTDGSGNGLCDLGTGAITSETVIVADLATAAAGAVRMRFAGFNVAIPSGSRLSARCQGIAATESITIQAFGYTRQQATTGNVTTYGTSRDAEGDDADTLGINIDPGATPDTKSAYVDFGALSANVVSFWVYVGGNGDISRAAASDQFIDVGEGGASNCSSVTIKVPDIHMRFTTNDDEDHHMVGPFDGSMTSGNHLCVRGESSVGTDGDRDMDVIVYTHTEGIDKAAGGGGPACRTSIVTGGNCISP